jgi:hypothetical protein
MFTAKPHPQRKQEKVGRAHFSNPLFCVDCVGRCRKQKDEGPPCAQADGKLRTGTYILGDDGSNCLPSLTLYFIYHPFT